MTRTNKLELYMDKATIQMSKIQEFAELIKANQFKAYPFQVEWFDLRKAKRSKQLWDIARDIAKNKAKEFPTQKVTKLPRMEPLKLHEAFRMG